MEIKAQQFIKNPDISNIKDIVVVFGNDDILKGIVLDKFRESIKLEVFWGDEIDFDRFSTKIKVSSLFGEKPSVAVKSASDFISNLTKQQMKEFIELLQRVSNQKVIFIFKEDQLPSKDPYKSILQIATFISCSKLSKQAFLSSIKKKFEKEGISIGDENVGYLANLLAYDLSVAKQEVEKLILLCKEKKVIEKEDIDALIVSATESSIFEFLDLFFKRDKSMIKIFENLTEKSFHPFQIQAFLLNQLEKVLYYKMLTANGLGSDEALVKIGITSPIQKNNIVRYSKFMTIDTLKEILKMLYTLEVNQKVYYKDIHREALTFLINTIYGEKIEPKAS